MSRLATEYLRRNPPKWELHRNLPVTQIQANDRFADSPNLLIERVLAPGETTVWLEVADLDRGPDSTIRLVLSADITRNILRSQTERLTDERT